MEVLSPAVVRTASPNPRESHHLMARFEHVVPPGTTACIASLTNRASGSSRTCCPAGTTCDEGTCRY